MNKNDEWEIIDTGVPDRELMETTRTVAEKYEPLITTAEFDDPLDPELLHLYVSEGVRSDTGRFDIMWTDSLYYRYHYTEGDQFNYRYDLHPRRDLPDNHFHEPPDARHDDAVESCIEVKTVRLVTLGVLQLWRDTIDSGDLQQLQQTNPP